MLAAGVEVEWGEGEMTDLRVVAINRELMKRPRLQRPWDKEKRGSKLQRGRALLQCLCSHIDRCKEPSERARVISTAQMSSSRSVGFSCNTIILDPLAGG